MRPRAQRRCSAEVVNAPVTVAWAAGLWRHPVKSMQGERLDAARLAEQGVPSDRRWAVLDPTGRALAAKVEPRLLEAAARLDGDDLVVILPSGVEVRGSDPDADDLLSAWLDRPVRLAEADGDTVSRYQVHVDAADDASDVVEIAGPVGRFADSRHPVHLLTTASLRAAARLHPEGDWDARRFRPNLLVDTDGEGFVEDGWVGSRLRIGTALLEVRKPTIRCSIPGRAQPGLVRDVEIVRTLGRAHGLTLGVYCGVLEPGEVALGDEVRLA